MDDLTECSEKNANEDARNKSSVLGSCSLANTSPASLLEFKMITDGLFVECLQCGFNGKVL